MPILSLRVLCGEYRALLCPMSLINGPCNRLHEVVSRAAVMSNGIRVAGLGPVECPSVENVDVSSALRGHMELQAKMPEILKIINVDG